MGQKVHPIGFRVGITREWDSRWYADKRSFAEYLGEDFRIRQYLKTKGDRMQISRVEIERAGAEEVEVIIHTARPGMVKGSRGQEVQRLEEEIAKLTRHEASDSSKDGRKFTQRKVAIKVKEVTKPELNAQLVSEAVAEQITRRVAFRRAMKKAVETTIAAGTYGIKIKCSGRLGGAEIAKSDGYAEGRLPLQKLEAVIDYGFAEAKTLQGQIGIKVWIYRGDIGDSVIPE